MEGGWFAKCGSRPSAAHARSKNLQGLHGLRITCFQHVALALAPRTCAIHSQEPHGVRITRVQNVVLAFTPCTL
eukprot:1358620-Pyramimonas_sp.AAC.1